MSPETLRAFSPELYLCGLGLLVLIADMVVGRKGRGFVAALTVVGLVGCLAPIVSLWGSEPRSIFSGTYLLDGLALFFKALFVVTGALVVLLTVGYGAARDDAEADALPDRGEFLSLLVFLVLGLCLMAGANDLVVLYLSFELVSLTSYMMAAWRKRDRLSNEAGVKYFVYGAAASAVMLYGLSLIYGAGGSTNLTVLGQHFMKPIPGAGLALVGVLGVLLMLVGLGYKISMVPFHAWAPDVYQGAPTPVTALLSVGPKAAGFALLLRVFAALSPALYIPWQVVLAMFATITMFGGNLLALRQTDMKRLLAYSSIAHAGYLLIGVVVGPQEPWGQAGILIYLVAYLLMNLGMFALAIWVERFGEPVEGEQLPSSLARYSGLAQRAPGIALLTVILLLSLTGIPPTAGFLGKLYLFGAAIKSHQWAWLAVVGIINSVISLYYYMNIARMMYFGEAGHAQTPRPVGGGLRAAEALLGALVLVTTAATVAVLVFPDWLVDAARLTVAVR
jgi:NADH-quinone oxidoreductase subunit N